jgi:hypothetical protein
MKDFFLGVSQQGFKMKPNDFKSIRFNKKSMDATELVEVIKRGHLICHNYGNMNEFGMKHKTNSNFKFTNLIWFDFDKCKYNIDELIKLAKIKPTLAYTTFSNTAIDNRFRFIYLMEDVVEDVQEYHLRTNLIFNLVFDADICNSLIKEKQIDTCCFSAHMAFLGSTSNSVKYFNPNVVLNFNFIKNIGKQLGFFNSNNNVMNYTTNVSSDVNYTYDTYLNFSDLYACDKLKQYVEFKCQDFSINKDKKKKVEKEIVLENGKNMTLSTNEIIAQAKQMLFNKSYVPKLNNFENATLSSNVYTYVGNDCIYSLNTYFGESKMVLDSKRNKTTYHVANVIVNINLEISLSELVASIIWFRNRFYQNPLTYTDYEIFKTAEKVKLNSERNDRGKKKYLINPELKNGLTKKEKMKYLGEARKQKRDEEILPNFNCNLTVKENAEILGKCLSTIYKCLNENGININRDFEYEKFVGIYFNTIEASRTVRKMADITGISRAKSERFIKRIKSGRSISLAA